MNTKEQKMTVGELIDSTSAIGIVEEDIFDPTFSIDIEAEKFRNYIK